MKYLFFSLLCINLLFPQTNITLKLNKSIVKTIYKYKDYENIFKYEEIINSTSHVNTYGDNGDNFKITIYKYSLPDNFPVDYYIDKFINQ